MKRIARLATIAAAVAFGLSQGGAFAQDAGYCPPGAKFCPTPDSAAAPMAADSGFGMGSYAMQSAPAGDAYFQSQLNEGEQLIMVAPGGDFANIPAPGQVPYAPPQSYAPQPAYAPPTNLYSAPVAYAPPATYAAPAPMPVNNAYAGGYAPTPAPVAASYSLYADPSDGLRGFVPSMPGSQPAYSSYEAPAPAMSYAPTPAPVPVQAMGYSPVGAPMGAGPAPLTADSFQTPYPQALAPRPIPIQVQRLRPEAMQTAAAPMPERHAYQNDPADPKRRRAEMLSEVANETSRRPDKLDLKPRNENRKPWWKGGFWNRKSDGSAEKKSKADIKAERREAELAARRAKEDAKRAKN